MTRTAWIFAAAVLALASEGSAPQYSAAGDLLLPRDYREWIFLSSGLGMTYGAANASEAAPRFDNVFVTREAYASFLKNAIWPDKTMFVLEVRTSESKGSINNGGHYQAGVAAVEAEVKERGRWTFYAFGATGTEGKAFPRTERCYTCHGEHGAVDNTFVQFYPTLAPIAKARGTFKDR
jgi:Cytochrome P460